MSSFLSSSTRIQRHLWTTKSWKKEIARACGHYYCAKPDKRKAYEQKRNRITTRTATLGVKMILGCVSWTFIRTLLSFGSVLLFKSSKIGHHQTSQELSAQFRKSNSLLMWNRASEAWQGRVNIWQICPHTETERSNRRSDRKTTKTVAVSALFELLLLLCRRATCSASFLFSKLPRRLETGPVASNPTWTQAWKFQGEKISSCWKDCWPCWWP